MKKGKQDFLKHGFTLIEAMVVVAIIGVLAAIGYAVLQNMVWQARASEVSAIFDGVMAKQPDGIYQPNKRVMLKVKHKRTADCVVGGFRWHKNGPGTMVGSLLLGLYDADGKLQHIGVAASFTEKLVRAYAQVRIGDPLDDETLMGPLIDAGAVKEMEDAIAAVREQGGEILCGGKRIDRPGNFVEPMFLEANFAFDPRSDRFLALREPETHRADVQMVFVTNWLAELKRLTAGADR